MLPAGFEPATCGLGIHRSIHLSYGSSIIFFKGLRLITVPSPFHYGENCGDFSTNDQWRGAYAGVSHCYLCAPSRLALSVERRHA